MTAGVIFILCALTSLACAILLWRGYSQSRVRLLLWSGLCFLGLALNNLLLFMDKHVITGQDLSLIRIAPAFIGMGLLLYGLIWERDQ